MRSRTLPSQAQSGSRPPLLMGCSADCLSGPASRSGQGAELFRGARCASHESAPTLARSGRLVVCWRSQAVGPDSVWEQPRLQIGSHRAVPYSRPTRQRGRQARGVGLACPFLRGCLGIRPPLLLSSWIDFCRSSAEPAQAWQFSWIDFCRAPTGLAGRRRQEAPQAESRRARQQQRQDLPADVLVGLMSV